MWSYLKSVDAVTIALGFQQAVQRSRHVPLFIFIVIIVILFIFFFFLKRVCLVSRLFLGLLRLLRHHGIDVKYQRRLEYKSRKATEIGW